MRKTVRNTARPENEALGRALKRLREKSGLTIRQMAEKIGRGHAFVWKVESGNQHIDIATVFDIAKAAGGDVVEIVSEVKAEVGSS